MACRGLAGATPADKAKSLAAAWHCELCGAPIAADRVARAIARGHRPRFCASVRAHLAGHTSQAVTVDGARSP